MASEAKHDSECTDADLSAQARAGDEGVRQYLCDVRDGLRQQHFDTIPGKYRRIDKAVIFAPDLGVYDRIVLAGLLYFDMPGKNGKHPKGYSFPSILKLARTLSISERQIQQSVARLVETQYLEVERGGGCMWSNRYFFTRKCEGGQRCPNCFRFHRLRQVQCYTGPIM